MPNYLGINTVVVKKVDCIFISLKVVFTLPNDADHDVMSSILAFYLGLDCLPKHAFRYLQYEKVKAITWGASHFGLF